MKKICFLAVAVITCYGALFAAEQITITTYYPSPYGSYNALQADKLGVGDNNGDGALTSADVPTTSGNVWIKDKVGIGDTDPFDKLSVAGNVSFNEDKTSRIRFEDQSTFQRIAFNELRFWDWQGGGDMVTFADGNVGIGTAAPGGKLEVNMGSNNNYFRVNIDNNVGLELRSGTSGGTPYIDFANDPGSDYESRIILINGNILQIQDSGHPGNKVLRLRNPFGGIDLYVAGNVIGFFQDGTNDYARVRAIIEDQSDIRRKKNIKPLTGVLDRLDKVRGVSFNWVSDNDKAIGVIAQEMEIVFPEVVTTDKSAKVKEGIPGEKFVSYAGVSAIALQGLKELKAEVRAQADTIRSQAKEITALKQRLK